MKQIMVVICVLSAMHIFGENVYISREDVGVFMPRAKRLVELDCGDANAQNWSGNVYLNKDRHFVSTNVVDTVNQFRKNAEQGDTIAQINLGLCYAQGDGVDTNAVEAVKWFFKAAEQGDTIAKDLIKIICDKTMDTQVHLYVTAAKQGDVQTQLLLGCFYEMLYWGLHVENVVEAKKWFSKAAEQGNAMAQCHLGCLYRDRDGVDRDLDKAVEWLEKAAAQKHVRAQYALALLYLNPLRSDSYGPGASTRAISLLRSAAANGHEHARLLLEQLGVDIQTQQLSNGRK
jgi:hypothetical protein